MIRRLAPALLLLLLACGGGGGGGAQAPSADAYVGQPFALPAGATGNPFTFVVLSDTHVRLPGNPDDALFDNQGNLDAFDETIDLVNATVPQAAFVVVTGDLVGALFSDDPADYGTGAQSPAETFKARMDRLTMPYHVVLGNHDYQKGYDATALEGITTDDLTRIEAVWRKVLGVEPWYAIVHQGVRLVFLDSCRGSASQAACPARSAERLCTGSFDGAQLAWLGQQLALPEPCLLFFHHPPLTDRGPDAGFDAYAFLLDPADGFYPLTATWAERIAGIFVGHGHLWAHDLLHGRIPVFETEAVADPGGEAGSGHVVHVEPAAGSYVVERLR